MSLKKFFCVIVYMSEFLFLFTSRVVRTVLMLKIFGGVLLFLTQKSIRIRKIIYQNMADRNKESVCVATFKKRPFQPDFNITAEDGKITSALCKYCSEMEYNAFMWEVRARNIKGSAWKSVENFQNAVTYSHRPTLARHVGNNDSLQNWCRRKLVPNVSDEAGISNVNLQSTQPTVSESFLAQQYKSLRKITPYSLIFARRRACIH